MIPKPTASLYFSKIQKDNTDPEEMGDRDPEALGLSWEHKLHDIADREQTQLYKKNDICFAKFHEDALLSEENCKMMDRFKEKGLFGGQMSFKWKEVSKAFHGVQVKDPAYKDWFFSGWNVPTIAVWDTRCMYDVKAFTNAGNWQYRVEAPTPTAAATLPETAETTQASKDLLEASARKKRRMN